MHKNEGIHHTYSQAYQHVRTHTLKHKHTHTHTQLHTRTHILQLVFVFAMGFDSDNLQIPPNHIDLAAIKTY